MKKFLSMAALVLSVMMVLGCASKAPASTAASNDEAAFEKIYNQYKGDLILEGAKTYVVVSGDTLSDISRASYNNGFYFPLIMLASSKVVLDPDRIRPGMELTIPDLQRNLDDSGAKGKIKSFLGEIAKLYDNRSRPADADGLRKLASTL